MASAIQPDLDLAGSLFEALSQATRRGRGIVRDSYGEGEQAAHDRVRAAAEAAGLEVSVDPIGNLSMTLPGRDRALPKVIVGSHLDSVPQGGNFDGAAGSDFLRDLRQILQPGDSLLLGTDMLKPVQTLIAAYDDSIGVTASFNLNLLARINRELGADFSLQQFAHVAIFNEATDSVEMHLRSRSRQKVTIPEASISVRFEKDETIWTESSHKYSQDELVGLAHHSGFHRQAQWMDQSWGFAENLWIAE